MYTIRFIVLSSLITVLLTSCGGRAQPVDPSTTLSGAAQNWEGGTATVQAVATSDEGAIVSTIDASGPLAQDGSFDLTLPDTVEGDALIASSIAVVCGGGEFDGTATPDAWQETTANLAVEQGDETVGFLNLASSQEMADFRGFAVGDFFVVSTYVTKDVRIQGTCTGESGTFDINVDVETGWNLVSFTIEALDDTSSFPTRVRAESVSAVPEGAEWYFVESEPLSEPGT